MKKFILLAAAAIALGACNTEYNYIDDPVAAQITATIGENAFARASNTWDEGDSIGVSMNGRYSNMKYITESGDGKFVGTTMYFKNKQEAVTLTAYYPYSGTEGQTPAVVETSTGVERQTDDGQPLFDFLYAVKENVTGAEPNVNLTFEHRMSKLSIIFKKGNDGTDISKITSCRIDGLIMEGTFNPVSGACSAKSTPATSITLTPTMEDGKALLHPLLLFPQTVAKVTLNIADSEDQRYSCELKFDGDRLESGNNYLYTINVKKTELVVEPASILPWYEKKPEKDPNASSSDD